MLADDLARTDLAKTIDVAFERREEISPATTGAVREAVGHALGPAPLAFNVQGFHAVND